MLGILLANSILYLRNNVISAALAMYGEGDQPR